MWILFIAIVIGYLVFSSIHDHNKDVKTNVTDHGGMLVKYKVLIDYLTSSNLITIVYQTLISTRKRQENVKEAVLPNKNRNPQKRYLRFLPRTFSSNFGKWSIMFSSISIEYLPVVLRSVLRMLSLSVFLNHEWNRLSTNIARTSASMLY